MVATLLGGPLTRPAHAEPAWTTYHRDAQRSGDDPDGTHPIEPAFAWQSVDLGAPIWSQPLVLGGRVYVATVGDEVYALQASTGKVVWEKSVGTPVPSGELPCGDITPTVGVVGTPVIDPATKIIYMVADTWDGTAKEAHHVLKGLSLADGKEVLSTAVDAPGADPKAILQRTALNLDGDDVVFGFGGNSGDCSDYQGTVVAAPTSGGAAHFWQYQPALPSLSGGAVWAPAGPSVDGAGYVYATTGNPDPPIGQTASIFDYSDSVVKLDQTHDFVANPATEAAPPLGWFEPPNWEEESNNDLDLSSAAAELLPGGLLFQAGKDGVGYLVDESTMETGAVAIYNHQVCHEHSGFSGSFGGDALAGGVIYIPCENGMQALAYSQSEKTFTPLWQGPSDAVGPPIVSAGLVWTIATGGFNGGGTTLYGLDPANGSPRYTETLPAPVIDHFASPSAAGGRLFVSTGTSVSAYRVAELTPVEEPPYEEPQEEPQEEPANENPTKEEPGREVAKETVITSAAPGSTLAFTPPAFALQTVPLLLHTHLRVSGKDNVSIALRCNPNSKSCQGTIALQARFAVARGRAHKHIRTVLVGLAHAHFGPFTGDLLLTLHLNPRAMDHLRNHKDRLSLRVTISSPGAHTRQVVASLT